MIVIKKYLFFFVCFCSILAYSQQQKLSNPIVPDSLLQKSYETLDSLFKETKNDTIKKQYAKAFLKKGLTENNIIKQADAYYFLSLTQQPAIAKKYADTIISITEEINNDTYPARGFLVKGLALYRIGEYKEALDQLMEAYKYAGIRDNASQQLEVKYFIAALKTDLGDDDEALVIFRSYLQETVKKYKNNKDNYGNYIRGLLGLGDAYNRNMKYDSAAIINKKGFEVSLKHKDSLNAQYFIFSMGVTEYFKGNYYAALDSIRKAKKAFIAEEDMANVTACYLYMGKIYKNQGKIKDAVLYFKKVDSIVEKTSNVFPEIREAYEFLIDYYDEIKNIENQLKYREHLKKVNSLLRNNHQYLSKTIDKKYDTPELINQINNIKDKSRKDQIKLIIFLSIALVFVSTFAFYYYRKQRNYRVRLKVLLSEKELDSTSFSKEILDYLSEKLTTFEEGKEFLNSDISLENLARKWEINSRYLHDIIRVEKGKDFRNYIKDLRASYDRKKSNSNFREPINKLDKLSHIEPKTLERLLRRLTVFEEKKKFRNKNIYLTTLAKDWETNTKYITDIIGVFKGKNFRDYLGHLRIDYIIRELKTNTNLRKYTVEALAEEAGFRRARTFSSTFHKRTGIYPSDFLKGL